MTTNHEHANHEHDGEDELQAARRTAHALGQTEGAERAEVAADLAAAPQARQEAEAVKALAARLKAAARAVPQPEPSPAIREAIERCLAELEPAAGRAAARQAVLSWSRSRLAALALTAVCLIALAIPIVWPINGLSPRKQGEVAQRIMTQDNMVSELEPTAPEKPQLRLDDDTVYFPLATSIGDAKSDKPADVAHVPPIIYPDAETWQSLTERRKETYSSSGGSMSAVSGEVSPVVVYNCPTRRAAIPYSSGQGPGPIFSPRPGDGPGPSVNGTAALPAETAGYPVSGEEALGKPNETPPVPSAVTLFHGDWLDRHHLALNGHLDVGGGTSATGPVDRFNGPIGYDDRTDELDLNQATFTAERVTKIENDPAAGSKPVNGLQISGLAASGGKVQLGGPNGWISSINPTLGAATTGADTGITWSGRAVNGYTAGLTLSGTGTYSGGTTVSAGTLQGPVTVNNNGAIYMGYYGRQSQSFPGHDTTTTDQTQSEIVKNGTNAFSTLNGGALGSKQAASGQSIASNLSGKNTEGTTSFSGSITLNGPSASTLTVGGNGNVTIDRVTMTRGEALANEIKLRALAGNATADDIARGISGTVVYSGAKPSPIPQVKPVESWKPAHVVPNSSRLMVGDKEELPIKGMQVDVRVDGFRARVLIDMYYFNDRPQQLEGNFQLRLPDEASPYFFAFGRTVYQAPQVTAADSMFFKPEQVSLGDTTPEKILRLRGNSWEEPKVARMVPKEKAALAYRDTVRRRVDPALVEWSGAGVFQCRVFPLAPNSLHRVTVGYDVDLVRVGDDLELRLDLPGQTPATIVDLNIAASDARQVSLDAQAMVSPDGQRLSYRLTDPKDSPLKVRLRKAGTQMLTGNDEATGSYFATRVGLTLPETPSADRAKQAIFLVDTSLSAGPQFPLWTKLLRATLDNNRDSIKEFAVEFFNVETFWWQEKFVANTPENVDALMAYADGLALEGATDLGRALKEAAAPKWLQGKMGFSPSPDLFLLSDGAATWGEDRWPLLAVAINSNTSPSMFENGAKASTPDKGSQARAPGTPGRPDLRSLFAYRTGLAGGDPRLLAYLAEQTGGAVFSLVGEAEIASASVAHRNRPWRLTGIEMAGATDLLVAGRPQYVFPGQQLTVVGRLEQNRTDRADRSNQQSLVFTLQQGSATQTVSVPMEQVLASELAARTFGQVATSQLEDVSGAAASAESVATAYARHFRITGRTCSLLMLESEQDYARFNIKPEEDSFVVKDRPAGPIVAKVVAEATAAMSDPKANFLAWYRRVREASEVHFDLPASLDVALESLPSETFAVTAPPLQCKLRLRSDLPENLRQPWQSGLPDYDTLDAEAQRRLTAYGPDDALRGLSSLVEDRPGDSVLARDLAFSALEWQRPGEAYHLLRRAGEARTFEPVTFHAMAHCLEQMGQADLAIVYYELASGGQWDARFGDMHNIAQLDYLRFLRRVADGRLKCSLGEYAKARLATMAALQLRDTADVAALIFWNTDGTDVDLHVIEPSGEECFYQHTQTASGGHISRDVTTGFGPELYLLPAAPAGNYRVSAHYYATDANRASTRTKVLAYVYEGWGTTYEKATVKALALTGRSENHELATVKR